MEQKPLYLRPMTVADILDAAIRIYRHNFAPLLAISALVEVPVMALLMLPQYLFLRATLGMQAGGPDTTALLSAGGVMLAVALLMWLLWPLGQAALAVAISERYLGRTISFSDAYGVALSYWPRMVWTSLVLGAWFLALVLAAAVVVGGVGAAGYFALLRNASPGLQAGIGIPALVLAYLGIIILFVWLFVRYLLATSVLVVLENQWGIGALRRSWQLTAGRFWSMFGVLLILQLLVAVAAYGLAFPVMLVMAGVMMKDPSQMMTVQMIYQALVSTVSVAMTPLTLIAYVLVYYDLRIRKEGFDLLMMAEALGRPVPEGYMPYPEQVPQQPLYEPIPQAPVASVAPMAPLPGVDAPLFGAPGEAAQGAIVADAAAGQVQPVPPPPPPPAAAAAPPPLPPQGG